MGRQMRRVHPKVWLACGLAVWLGALVTVRGMTTTPPEALQAAQEKPPTAVNKSQAQQPAVGLVGEDTCLGCHAEKTQGYHGSPHAVKTDETLA